MTKLTIVSRVMVAMAVVALVLFVIWDLARTQALYGPF